MITTLADIAKKANVSKMTVSRVLNGKDYVASDTRKRIMKIVEEFNYHPNLVARSLASKRTMILGVIIPKITHMFLDNYIAQILSGVTDVALQNNYQIILCPIESNKGRDSEYLRIARSKLIDGLLLLKTKIDDPNILTLAKVEFPFVLVNHKKYSKHINFVDSQNIRGARKAVEYLYQKGHRDIAHVAGSMDETNGRDRLKGFKDAMNDFGLKVHDEWIVYGDFNEQKAYLECEKLFSGSQLPSAIFCGDDYMAIGVMERIKEKELSIPEDIAVMGFDDIELASYIKPALTTIRQPIYKLGKASAELLLSLIKDTRKGPSHKLLNVDLMIRESA